MSMLNSIKLVFRTKINKFDLLKLEQTELNKHHQQNSEKFKNKNYILQKKIKKKKTIIIIINNFR